jgi:hypothetical protein
MFRGTPRRDRERRVYPNPKCGDDFAAHIKHQSEQFTRLIRELNIKTG